MVSEGERGPPDPPPVLLPATVCTADFEVEIGEDLTQKNLLLFVF